MNAYIINTYTYTYIHSVLAAVISLAIKATGSAIKHKMRKKIVHSSYCQVINYIHAYIHTNVNTYTYRYSTGTKRMCQFPPWSPLSSSKILLMCMYEPYQFMYVCMCDRAVEKEESMYHQLKFDLYFGDIASVILSTSKIEYIVANCEDDNVSVCMYVCMYVCMTFQLMYV